MDTKIEKKSETKREIEVTIPVEEMENYIDKAAKKFSEEMNIKGFRPGNAPRDVIENTVGKEKLFEEAAREAVQGTYPKIIEENNLFALSSPKVDLVKCAPGNDVVYRALVYIMPEINLPDYKKIAKDIVASEKKDGVVEEKEVDQAINRMRETKAKLEKVDKGAEKGDAVTLNFKGVFKGNEEKKVEESNFQVVLGGGDLDALEGFEENILNMKEGEKKNFSVNASSEKAAGAKTEGDDSQKQIIDFEVEVTGVMERELPELNDEFAKAFPEIENMSQLREKIKEGMKQEKDSKEREKVKVKVLHGIKTETEFEVPEILVEKEIDNMVKTVENQLAQKGSSFDNYLQEIGKTEEDLRGEWKKKAEENVSFALILHTISKKENIDVTAEEVEQEVDRHFTAMGKNKEEESKENMERMRAYIHDTIKNQKVFGVLSIEESSF